MVHEISQFDILNRQLLTINAQPRVNKWSDLGEARITRTFLGGAKVRVIRDQDRKLRAWLLTALVAIAIPAAVWQGWITYQNEEVVVPQLPLSERIQVSQPVFAPETIPPDPHPSRQKSISLIQTEIDGLLSGPLPKRPPPVLQAPKPVASGQSKVGKPLASIQNTSKPETAMQQSARLSATQHVVKTIAVTPRPAKNKPAPIATLRSPPIKDDSPVSASKGIIQFSSPSNTQPTINSAPQVNPQAQANTEPQVNTRGAPIMLVDPEENTQAVSK